jgi:hypothetical protein
LCLIAVLFMVLVFLFVCALSVCCVGMLFL